MQAQGEHQSGYIVVVAYKPKAGKEADLLELTREHVPYLQSQGLATDRAPIVGRASDGTIVEVFEWAPGGVEKAHKHPGVMQLWERYAAACEILPLSALPESKEMFAGFQPVAI